MNILLLGSGGREHTLAWKIAQSKLLSKLYIAPGNPGTIEFGENINVAVLDFEGIKNICIDKKINMLVVGPEDPLVQGIYDFIKQDVQLSHIAVIGPSQYGAQLEGSKAFAKAFMQRHKIPTAAYQEFTKENFEEGKNYIKAHSLPIVLKADGLAAGKGVIISNSHEEALQEYEEMIQNAKFGEAGNKVVIEEFLNGIELSVFALTDGKEYIILPNAKDYKRIGEGDTGLNTGGMGAISPVPFADEAFLQIVEDSIVKPTIDGLYQEQINYTGFVFFGLINVGGKPWVIEYNCRLGDPETEVVLPRLQNDLLDIFIAATTHKLSTIIPKYAPQATATIVAVSKGYPGAYEKGISIEGANKDFGEDSILFHSGTKMLNEQLVTQGGRVLCITSYGQNIKDAVNKSKAALKQIHFNGMYYRSDIGYEFE